MAPPEDNQTRAFASSKAWETWLARNHAKSPGLWLQIYKKGSGQRSDTTTRCPCWARRMASVLPTGPQPTMATSASNRSVVTAIGQRATRWWPHALMRS